MKKKTIRQLWRYLGRNRIYLIGVIFFALFGNILSLLGPLYIGQGINDLVGMGEVNFPRLGRIALLLIGLYFVSSLAQWIMAMLSNVIANKTISALRKEAFDKLSCLPLRYFDNNPHGDVISRLTNDIDAISEGLFQGITQILSGLVVIIGTFGFMLSISPLITLVVVAITPICYIIASFIAKMSSKMFQKQTMTLGELNGYVEEMIGNQKVVKAFGYEKRAERKFGEINDRLYVWGQKSQWYSSLTNPTTRFVNNIAYVAVTVFSGFLAVMQRLNIGQVSAFITYSTQFAKPINEITSIATQIQSAVASAGRVFQLLEEEPEIQSEEVKTWETCKGLVEFHQVDFSYRPDTELIADLNLRVEPGQMVAIVGPTGAGKSTLVNLLMRFYDVNNGSILVDGVDIRNIDRDCLRTNIGMVLQESWLFSGTIAENISYGKPEATREEIEAAAKEAHAHSFIMRLQNGYDTMVEEDGRNLSIGQKQLLTIARAILVKPAMLILDEATSSIDTRTEIRIQKAFNNMMQDRTSFVIAHRLSTIREADIILVMNYGKIIEQGSHDELLSQKGFYYELYNSQFEKKHQVS